MRVRDLIEELIQIEKDYGNLPVNQGVDLNIEPFNNSLNIEYHE